MPYPLIYHVPYSTGMQHWYNHEVDPAMWDALYEMTSMRLRADLSLDIHDLCRLVDQHPINNFQAPIRKQNSLRHSFLKKWINGCLTRGIISKKVPLWTDYYEATALLRIKQRKRPLWDAVKHIKGKQWFLAKRPVLCVDAERG